MRERLNEFLEEGTIIGLSKSQERLSQTDENNCWAMSEKTLAIICRKRMLNGLKRNELGMSRRTDIRCQRARKGKVSCLEG